MNSPMQETSQARTHHERWGLLALLVGTATLNLWGLGASGWANSFYSAAVQAGSESWSAFFFGASDAAGSITVDKPPLALWPMALSVKVFGLSSWSILVPQAIIGVASVALLFATVRRATRSTAAGLIAGAALALTPVAVLMFRFNNPDALLVLLLIGSAYATLRAVEATDPATLGHPVRWMVLGGSLVGLAFLTKMLQGFLVLPSLALTYALFALVPWHKKLWHLLAAVGSMIVAGSWWIAIVELWPASDRPYIGGSQNNSMVELMLGYNGFGRLTGNEVGSVSSGSGWGQTGLLRMFYASNGGQIAWLLPAGLILAIAAAWLLHTSRTAPDRRPIAAALTLWLSWLVLTALTFSLMAGIYHPYYTVALAPAIGACVGIGSVVCWRAREQRLVTWVFAGTLLVTAGVAFLMLWRADGWLPWLKYAVVAAALVTSWLIVNGRHLPSRGWRVAVLALGVALAGPASFSLATVGTPHSGAVPSAGPAGSHPTTEDEEAYLLGPESPEEEPSAVGSLLDAAEPTPVVRKLLLTDAADFTWVAAVTGANSASGFQLATQRPVMPIGGFNGTDPSPTLAQFKEYVADARIHFYIAGGAGTAEYYTSKGKPIVRTGSDAPAQIAAWVELHFVAQEFDGVPIYDLTQRPVGAN